jgi:hypothetical protein
MNNSGIWAVLAIIAILVAFSIGDKRGYDAGIDAEDDNIISMVGWAKNNCSVNNNAIKICDSSHSCTKVYMNCDLRFAP